jgi:hypothetical protein
MRISNWTPLPWKGAPCLGYEGWRVDQLCSNPRQCGGAVEPEVFSYWNPHRGAVQAPS